MGGLLPVYVTGIFFKTGISKNPTWNGVALSYQPFEQVLTLILDLLAFKYIQFLLELCKSAYFSGDSAEYVHQHPELENGYASWFLYLVMYNHLTYLRSSS